MSNKRKGAGTNISRQCFLFEPHVLQFQRTNNLQVNNSATVPSNSGIPLHEEGRNELYVSGKRCLQASDLKAAISGEFAQRSKSWTTDEGEAYNGTRLAMRCDLMTILERVTQCPFVNCPHPPAPKVTPH